MNKFYTKTIMLLVVAVLAIPQIVSAQCNITLSSQADVDNFTVNHPTCLTSVNSLTINGNSSSITDLGPLSGITQVTGTLRLMGLDVTTLNGINNLNNIGALRIENCDNITTISGFNTPTSINEVRIQSCDNLTAVTGFSALTNINVSLRILNNDQLTTFTGMSSLLSVGRNLLITASSNMPLTDLSGLSNLQSVGRDVYFRKLNNLTSLADLSSLTTIGRRVRVRQMDVLEDLDFLSGVTTLNDYVRIEENPLLSDLTGMTMVSSIGGELRIDDNAALTNLDGLDNVMTIGGNILIRDNATLTSITALNNTTSVSNVSILDNPQLLNVDGLAGLTTVGSVTIQDNGALTSIGGLTSTNTISTLTIRNNDALTDISSLMGVTSITTLSIRGNAVLTSLNGLQGVTSLNSLRITSNPMLTDCAIATITCNFMGSNVSGNAGDCVSQAAIDAACLALPVELSYFDAKIVNDGVKLAWTTQSELNNDYFAIERSVNGGRDYEVIAKQQGAGTTTEVQNYNYMDRAALNGEVRYRLVQYDFDGQYAISEVEFVFFDEKAEVVVAPNPVVGEFTLQGLATDQLYNLNIYNQNGQLVKTVNAVVGQSINIDDLPSGIYMLMGVSQTDSFTTKFLK